MEQLECSIALNLKLISAQSDHSKKQFFSFQNSFLRQTNIIVNIFVNLRAQCQVDFFSLSCHYVTDVGFGASLKNAIFYNLLLTHAHNQWLTTTFQRRNFAFVDFNDAAGEDFDISASMFRIMFHIKVSIFNKDKAVPLTSSI